MNKGKSSEPAVAWKRKGIGVSDIAPVPLGAYSHAVQAGPLLFIAGMGARDAQSGEEAGLTLDALGKVVAYDIEAQTRAVMKNLTAVLTSAGCTLKDLVDVSVFLVNMSDFQQFNRVYSEYFSFDQPPARTTVQAAGLPGRNFIEIKAVALCPTD